MTGPDQEPHQDLNTDVRADAQVTRQTGTQADIGTGVQAGAGASSPSEAQPDPGTAAGTVAMPRPVLNRWLFALFGAASGYGLWLLADAAEQDILPAQLVFFCAALLVTFTGGFFAMAGRLSVARTAIRALLLAGVVAGLALLLSLRWPELPAMFSTPAHVMALCAVAVLPVPFLLAQGGGNRGSGNWRNYPALFDFTWEIITRGLVACFFAGMVWVVLALSALLLSMVGITVIGDLLRSDAAPLLISGAAFGLAVAVVDELSSMLSPQLIHWLLRLLLPLVTLVSSVFVGAVIVRGYGEALRGLSPSLVLLSIAAAGIVLVTVALDADDESASKSPVILWSARGMVVLLPVIAALSLRAIWLRIEGQGLTPNRLFVLVLGLIALAYGLVWLVALMRGLRRRGRFAAGVRATNPWLGAGLILCAILWLTPLFNAEALSARDQANRVMDGRKPAAGVSWRLFRNLGHAGEAERARLQDFARQSGDSALVARLDPTASAPAEAPVSRVPQLRAEVKTLLPVQPESATGTRDMFLDELDEWQLDTVASACRARLAGRESGCLMVVADLLPAAPGEEAVVLLIREGGGSDAWGLTFGSDGRVVTLALRQANGELLGPDRIRALLDQWMAAPPPLAPARLNQLGSGDDGILFLP